MLSNLDGLFYIGVLVGDFTPAEVTHP